VGVGGWGGSPCTAVTPTCTVLRKGFEPRHKLGRRRRCGKDLARNAEFSTSLSGGHHVVLPPRALWRVSAGCDTAYDGWMREGQALGCAGTCKTACVGAPYDRCLKAA
jgi:hypothetical protein